jgi:hypothetical protein
MFLNPMEKKEKNFFNRKEIKEKDIYLQTDCN